MSNKTINVKFITKESKILDVEKTLEKDLYFTKDFKEGKVNYSNLYVYGDYKFEVENCQNGVVGNVTPAEVVSKIPDEILDRIYAVEILFSSNEETIKFFPQEKASSFGVIVVRLYEVKGKNDIKEASKKINWPEANDVVPIGMTEHEFELLKEYYKVK